MNETALLTLIERYNRTEIIVKISATCRKALQDILVDCVSDLFKTITLENGSEFAQLIQVTETGIYFAHLYSS